MTNEEKKRELVGLIKERADVEVGLAAALKHGPPEKAEHMQARLVSIDVELKRHGAGAKAPAKRAETR